MASNREGYTGILMDVLRSNVHSVEDLVALLEIEIDDVLDRFTDRVYEQRKRILADFGPTEDNNIEDDDDSDEDATEAWGFHMVPDEED